MTVARALAAPALVAALSAPGAAMAIEKPAHEVVRRYADFEVRDYAPRVVAETEVRLPRKEAGNEGFRRLAGFIFGKNRGEQRIAMTAPVAQRDLGGAGPDLIHRRVHSGTLGCHVVLTKHAVAPRFR